MPTILAIALKDLRVLSRVRAAFFFTFVWPLMVAILFGSIFSGQNRGEGPSALPVALVDDDRTDGSRTFIQRLLASGDFAVTPMSRAEAEDAVRRGRQAAMVVIAPGYGEASARMFYGPPRRIEIGSDPSRGAEAGMIEGLLTKHAMADLEHLFTNTSTSRDMVGRALDELRRSPRTQDRATTERFLTELDRYLAAPESQRGPGAAAWTPLAIEKAGVARQRSGPENAFAISFPQGMVWGIIGCVMTFAIGLVSERVRGTFVRLEMAPLTRTTILGGKALACFASIALLQAVLVTIGAVAFGIRPSSPWLLVAACLSAGCAFVGFMMMIAGLGRSEQSVSGVGWALLMPMALFGGAMIPQAVMPPWMLTVGHVSPIKWSILAFEGAIWRGFSAAEMLLPCAILLGFGLLCFSIGVTGLRKA